MRFLGLRLRLAFERLSCSLRRKRRRGVRTSTWESRPELNGQPAGWPPRMSRPVSAKGGGACPSMFSTPGSPAHFAKEIVNASDRLL